MTQISCRVDDNVKIQSERIFNDIGLSTSSAINIFLKKVIAENKIPFELSADPFYSQTNMNRLEQAYNDVKEGRKKLQEHDLIEVD